MTPQRLLPIKVVFPSPVDYQAPSGRGGPPKFFGLYSDELRVNFSAQLDAIGRYFGRSFEAWSSLPAIAKVRMKGEASAKSHRPDELFNETTCPVVGANRLGELFVSVTPAGLHRLDSKLLQVPSLQVQAQLTALEDVVPYTPKDALLATAEDLAEQSGKDGSPGLRYRLFRHPSREVNSRMEAAMRELAAQLRVKDVEALDYGEDLRVFRVRAPDRKAVESLAEFVGAQSLSPFPGYRIVRSAARVIGAVNEAQLPPPDRTIEYPVVGLIDSGTDPNNPHLQAWVKDRLDLVPRAFQNNDHGSFVAGILARGRVLNHDDHRFPDTPCMVIDVVALDRAGTTNEMDLLDGLDQALTRYPHVKVWNLSLGGADPCCNDEFSMFGSALDDRARKHNVTFIVAAGNFRAPPFRTWPPDGTLGEEDRICPPADAVRAITVASRAHTDTPSSRVKREEPSPFTRRGPGPAYLIKPEVAHYGGNCDAHGACVQSGIVSIDGSGNLAEDVGTSFACPFISAVAGHIEHQLRSTAPVSSNLVKAMLVHSAFLCNPLLDAERIKYEGVGVPGDLTSILWCTQSMATVVFQIPVQAKPEFGKRPFPIPQCLNGPKGLNCEIFMTLLYDPPLDRGFGFEYCRTNVNASLGTVDFDLATGEEKYTRELQPTPKELSEGYEENLIKHGYKWSPIKFYYRRLRRGPTTKPWRLTLELLNRAEYEATIPQDVVLLVTIKDPAGVAAVYDELVQTMNALNWNTQDLQVQTRARI